VGYEVGRLRSNSVSLKLRSLFIIALSKIDHLRGVQTATLLVSKIKRVAFRIRKLLTVSLLQP